MRLEKEITASVIAGGKSRRFGRDKLLYKYRGKFLIEHVLDVLKSVFKDVVIIANDPGKLSYLDLPVYSDIIKGAGPIGGIYTALHYSGSGKTFCFAGDMPRLNSGLIKYMISVSEDYDIVVPKIGGNYEALHTIYGKECMPHIERSVSDGINKIINIFDSVRVKNVSGEEISRFTSAKDVFKNINYLEDIEPV